METQELKLMSVDQLWTLHEELVTELGRKIAAEKATPEQRLRKLGFAGGNVELNRLRRPYPKVAPKYQNPKNSAETWGGTWQATPLAQGAASIRQETGRFPNQGGSGSNAKLTGSDAVLFLIGAGRKKF